jgi:hypothetical protein
VKGDLRTPSNVPSQPLWYSPADMITVPERDHLEARMRRPLLSLALLATLVVVATPAAAAGLEFNVTGGLDIAGSFDLDVLSSNADPGFTLGLEVMFDVPVVELGAGVEYGFSRNSGVAGADAQYWHFYGIGRLFVFSRFYIAARLGYYDLSVDDLIAGNVGNDYALGLGAGVGILRNLKVELFFNNVTSSLDYDTWAARVVYTF